MTEIPAELVQLAWTTADLGEAVRLDEVRSILALVLPAHERMVREQVDAKTLASLPHIGDPDAAALYQRLALTLTTVIADDTEADIREAVQRALNAPEQPATDATRDTDTTGSTEGGTGDLSAFRTADARYLRRAARAMGLPVPEPGAQASVTDDTSPRERIADALTQWALNTARAGRTPLPRDEANRLADWLTDAVMDALRPALERLEQRAKDAERREYIALARLAREDVTIPLDLEDLIATALGDLDWERADGVPPWIMTRLVDALRPEIATLTERAEQAERELAELRAANAEQARRERIADEIADEHAKAADADLKALIQRAEQAEAAMTRLHTDLARVADLARTWQQRLDHAPAGQLTEEEAAISLLLPLLQDALGPDRTRPDGGTPDRTRTDDAGQDRT